MTTLPTVELGVLGPLQVRQYGLPVSIPGAKPRAILTMLGLHGGSVVSADTLVELLWGDDPPRTAAKALQTHISSLRRALGDGFVLTQGTGWTLSTTEIDATRYKVAARLGRDAVAAGDTSQAVARFDEALTLWRGIPELPDGQRGVSEKTRWIEGHAALVEDRADALLATGRAAEIIGDLEAAIADAPLRERRWGQLILALYRAGRQGEALGAYQRVRAILADQLGVDPGPDLRRLEAAIVTQDIALEMPVSQQLQSVTRAVTFLLTDIEGSTAAWEADADAMAVALARHDEIVEQVVTSRGGRLIKTRGEGDATFSVFDRPSAAAAGAIELQEAIFHEPWALAEPMRIRVALHTGEVEFRDGDYFGRAVNRAARLRSLAAGGQILCSGATAELVIDTLPDDVVLADLGMRQLKNLPRPEHVFELRLENADDFRAPATEVPIERPALPAVLAGPGPFVGRGPELERLLSAWQTTLDGGIGAVLIAGEPGVGKTRLAGEWSRHAYEQGAVVIYGRCDEDLGAPYQPFAEALRSLVPCLGAKRLRGLRGVEALLSLVPGLTDVLPDLAAPTRADPDTERYALFDAVVAVLGVASAGAPVVLILDDLHWAAKPTLLLLRHLLRFGEHARVQVVGTYRSTDLDRSHPLAAMLADLHRDGSATRLQLSGLDEVDVSAFVAEAGYDDEELGRALASVTGGNPFFLIEALRHVDESGGRWDSSTLPQGVREAVSRRLSRLPAETNKALAAAAVVGSRFSLELVERVVGVDLIDAFDEACKAGIVIEEPGGRYRFNHALVRQSLLAELASVRRMRLHQSIAATLETEPGADDELLADLAHHYFECAWAGNAAKAVDYCRRAADQAMARLAYEGAADLYDHAVHALEEVDEELPDRDDQQAELLVARCEALLAAGDVASAAGAVSQLQAATRDSPRLAAWGTCFDGQLSMLTDPERLDEIESALTAAAEKLAELDDAAGEAKAHTVRAGCLARLGRIADAETALDHALTAARRAREHRRVNAVLANAPLAALWGPNPVPRAGGRCLDVVRLLRITTGSPVVEATSTRCQAVLDALRGRAAAGRSLLDSARRTLTELGMRHALLEVDQFAGILELVADDPAAAEPHLRRAYNGFRRMGLDADTAETAALLARACLALDRDAEADELCTESERLAGHALKPSIAWRTVQAQLLARNGTHAEARRVAEEAVAVAERTDLLVDHGDACLALATVLKIAGDGAGARAAAEQAVGLYELKGAAALAETARSLLGAERQAEPARPETPSVELDNACVRVCMNLAAAVEREAWDEVEQLFAPECTAESRRKVVGFTRMNLTARQWPRELRRYFEMGMVRHHPSFVAVRGERLALFRLEVGTEDASPGAPRDEMLQLVGLDEEGGIALQVWFDVEDMDAAVAELDAAHARFEEKQPRPPLENAASRADGRLNALFADRRFDEIGALFIDDLRVEDRRRGLHRVGTDRATELAEVRAIADLGTRTMTSDVIAIRGERLALVRTRYSGRDDRPGAFHTVVLRIAEIGAEERIVSYVAFDADDIDAAFEELDARYLAGEAAPCSDTWSILAEAYASIRRHELPPTMSDCVGIDHRRTAPFAPGDMAAWIRTGSELDQVFGPHMEVVHRLTNRGGVITYAAQAKSPDGFDAEWREISMSIVDGDMITRCELFDEADIDAALAKFDELSRPAHQLENAASRVYERVWTYFAAHDWVAVAENLADDMSNEDRRRVANAGIRHGRDELISDMRTSVDLGLTNATFSVTATRGNRLVLTRAQYSTDAYQLDGLDIIEIDADDRVAAVVSFDPDDIDAAFEELDARYLAGEAAAHAHTWSIITGALAAVNRHELPEYTPDWVNIDHRRAIAFAPGDMTAYMHATWDHGPDGRASIEAVHRLSNLGALVTQVGHEISPQGFEAEWRLLNLGTIEGDQFNRIELFDEADLDVALARFDELTRPAPRLENAASRVYERFNGYLTARDWDAMAALIADDVCHDDRRRVVSGGIQRGRDAQIANLRAVIDVGVRNMESVTIATRGERLALTRTRISGGDQQPEAFGVELLNIVEIDTDNRIAAGVQFDVDDIDAALSEIDARYLAGEAAAHAHSWSVIVAGHAAVNRRELPPTAPDLVSIDHRRAAAFAPGEGIAYIRAGWDLDQSIATYIEEVHRLNDFGAVYTHAGHGVSNQGFDAEWRGVDLLTIEGDLVNRCEVFDEVDLDVALARFDEIDRPAPQLENAASRVCGRFEAYFAARDWTLMSEMLAEDMCNDDRRRVVGAGVLRGRDTDIANMRAIADVGAKTIASTFIATRGERLVLRRVLFSDKDHGPEAFKAELLGIVEIDADERITARVSFDADEFDAAFAELDARYLAGEGAAHAHTWSLVARNYAAFNRHEFPPVASDWVTVDHRRGTSFEPGDMTPYIRATWDVAPDTSVYIETVHRVSDLGAVITQVSTGTTQHGFEAAWREICLLTYDAELTSGCELFDEADLEAALARFDELSRLAPRLENAASQVAQSFSAHFAARDWDAMAEMLAADYSADDRRRVVNAGIRHGRATEIENFRAAADLGFTHFTSTVIATRGEHLVLTRLGSSVRDQQQAAFQMEMFGVTEIKTDKRIAASVAFDLDDIDAAFRELDARYLAGEAALHAHTWSVIARALATFNRRELPGFTPDAVNVDHRRARGFAPGDLTAYIGATWDVAPDVSAYAEAVHRLSNFGAVFTQAVRGTSQDGFDAEWQEICLATVEGDLISRIEMFDEEDLDAALARFDELSRPARPLENAASQRFERFVACFAARDWAAVGEMLAEDVFNEDRRRVVNAGVLHGRAATVASMRASGDLGVSAITSIVIATRGERLALSRDRFSVGDPRPEAFHAEVLGIVEIDAHNRLVTRIAFDLDDVDAAFDELEARYLAGEGAAHAHTWSVIAETLAASNRHELPEFAPGWENIDRRRAIAFAPGDLTAYMRATWDVAPDTRTYFETVHRLSELGAVVTQVVRGTAHQSFEAEWREIDLLTIDGDLVNRVELFEEADIDAALARFDELDRPAPQLENAASRAVERFLAHFTARDWDAMPQAMADNYYSDDRRRVVGAGVRHGRDAAIENYRAMVDVGFTSISSTVIATRGERVVLTRAHSSSRDELPEAFRMELLVVIEINASNRVAAVVVFDPNDIDAAVAELDARYLAGEAAAHSQTWSVIAGTYVAFNRHGLVPDWVSVDHRRGSPFASGDLNATIRASRDITPDLTIQIETVHRLSAFGAVVTNMSFGTSDEGFAAEWRMVQLLAVDGDRITRLEIFDEDDIDAALTGFDELSRPGPQLENAACRVFQRYWTSFATRDWAALALLLAADVLLHDHRRVVNSGVRHGRDSEIASLRVLADHGVTDVMSTAIATRGERLALTRTGSAAFQTEVLNIVEIDADERIVAMVAYDADGVDAAVEELDARYLAGEAAAHAPTWSVIAGAYAAINRRELAATTPDCVNIDHRRGTTIAPGDLIAFIRASWDLDQQSARYVEAVHRLNKRGAVFTHQGFGTSQEGFAAEWRCVTILTVDGDMISGCELFDEGDLDAALARLDELDRPAPRLENAASRVAERFSAYMSAPEWAAMAEMVAEDMCNDDRRPVVNAGLRRGRDAEIANVRVLIGLGVKNTSPVVVATRGERLALGRIRLSGRDQRPEAFHTEVLGLIEVDADDRIAARVWFDLDDTDAAFEELESRYLAGEAAAHADTWSVIAQGYAALNRQELPATASDWVNIDHRRGRAFVPGDLFANLRSVWDLVPDITTYIEAVHRQSNLGAVVTHVAHGTSQEGFEAEWREINLLTVEGDLINRCEIFDEEDLDAALARFDELSRPVPRLENAASRVDDRFEVYFAARDWDAMAELVAEAISIDDRRPVVNAGLRLGRDVEIANMRAIADLGTRNATSAVIATRGERLALSRNRFVGRDLRPEAFHSEALCIIEIDDDARIVARVAFDPNDIDGAFEELDARYLAGEAAAHAHTWSVIAKGYAALNRRELPATTPDWVNVDHRHGTGFEPGGYFAFVRAAWDVAPDMRRTIEAVHRLNHLGAVFTHRGYGTSREGVDAEWRTCVLVTVDGELINRCELFDEADIDAAMARFDELSAPARQLENAAIRARARGAYAYNHRDVEGFLALASGRYEDRRKGLRDEGAADRNFAHAVLSETPTSWRLEVEPVAIRGDRLSLSRETFRDTDEVNQPITVELIVLTDIADAEFGSYTVFFDPDDIDAAFAELDTRYLAGEAAAHSHTWSVIAGGYAEFNRRQIPATTPDFVNIDHRRGGSAFAPGEQVAFIRASWEDTPDIRIHIEAVHRLSDLGAVVTQAVHGTSQAGFEADWREIHVVTLEGELSSGSEMFDEADLVAALARFDELSRPTQVLENAATRVHARMMDAFNRRDLDSFLAIVTADGRYEDRRKGLRDEGPIKPDFARALFVEAAPNWQEETEAVAIRGRRLVLYRLMFRDHSEVDRPIAVEALVLTEVTDDELASYVAIFDPDDLDGAMAELTARWIASGEVANPEVIEAHRRLLDIANRHDWDTFAIRSSGATYVGHRQLAVGDTIADYISSIRMLASLVPDLWLAPVEILSHSALGVVTYVVMKGTSTEGAPVELPLVGLVLFDGDRVSRVETFDPNQRDLAVARFDELNRPG